MDSFPKATSDRWKFLTPASYIFMVGLILLNVLIFEMAVRETDDDAALQRQRRAAAEELFAGMTVGEMAREEESVRIEMKRDLAAPQLYLLFSMIWVFFWYFFRIF